MQAFLASDGRAGKVGVGDDVADPRGRVGRPGPAGKADAGRKRRLSCQRLEAWKGHRGRVPNLDAAQDVGTFIDAPDGTYVPAKAFAEFLEDAPGRLLKRCRLRQHAGDGMLGGLAAFGGFAIADVAADGKHGRFAVELDHRSVDVDGEDAAVLGDVASFAGEPARSPLAARALGESGGECRFVEVAGIEPEELFAGVSQSLARRRVGIEDAAVGVVDEDRIVDAVEQGAVAMVAAAFLRAR